MRITVLVTIIAATNLAAHNVCAQNMTPTVALEAEEQRVLAAEDAYVAAELSRDEAALRKMVDDRFVFNSSPGTTSGKEALIQNVLGMNMTGQTIRERSVLIEGDVAFVFGTADLRFGGPGRAESVSTLRYTSTFVKRQGEWHLLSLQMQARAPD